MRLTNLLSWEDLIPTHVQLSVSRPNLCLGGNQKEEKLVPYPITPSLLGGTN